MRLSLLPFLCFLMASYSVPIPKEDDAMLYLQRYGYLEASEYYRSGSASISEEGVVGALKDFQRFVGLKQTGVLDSNTLTKMKASRCGIKDVVGHAALARRKRYADMGEQDNNTIAVMKRPRWDVNKTIKYVTLDRRKRYANMGSKWKKNRITYRISKYPSRLRDERKVDKEMARAIKVWSEETGLAFEERKRRRGRVNIDVRFEVGEHGCPNRFPPNSKIYGHGFAPYFGGAVHFNDEQEWTINQPEGINIFQAAVHEFGHALGLDHSDDENAIMGPLYTEFSPSFKLGNDDVTGIHALYGTDNKSKPSVESKEAASGPFQGIKDAPDLCQDPVFDTIARTQNGKTYVFKGHFYWKIVEDELKNRVAKGPRKISDDWDKLEGNLDASFTWASGKTFFFKGQRYWRFTNKEMDLGYPKLISVGFEGVPDSVDAALIWSGNGKSYFFKGDQYWRYESNKDPPVAEDNPRPITNWKDLPNRLDAAFQWTNGRTYFFNKDEFYRFDDISFAVDTADPPYPRKTSAWWFGCNSISNGTP